MKSTSFLFVLLTGLWIFAAGTHGQDSTKAEAWLQFRGNNCSGISDENAKPPIELTEKTTLWKIDLPVGHSSPIVWNDKIFVTGFIKESSELKTICVNRETGEHIWKQSVFPEKIEGYHPISSAAQTTPVTDGEYVYVYFGSYGVLCYSMEGNLVWDYKIDVHPYRWGVSSSPIVYDNKLIISRDISNERQLFALNKKTGEIIWKTELPQLESPWTTNWATPVVYRNDQIILHRAGEIASYSIEDGHRIWWLPYLTSGTSTPVIHNDMIYIGTWHNYSEEDLRANFPKYLDFTVLVNDFDSNNDGLIQKEEIPDSLMIYTRPGISEIEGADGNIKQFFGSFDNDKNGAIDQPEWDAIVNMIKGSFYKEAGLIVLNPDANGELSLNHLIWRESEKVPEVPSPIFYNDLVFMCKDGGILTCMDAEKGTVFFRESVGATGLYIASPVAANGYIYLTSVKGKITVIKATDKLNIINQNDLKEDIFASPAIIGNTIYVRTKGNLCAFRENY